MEHEIRSGFDKIHASQELKNHTLQSIQQRLNPVYKRKFSPALAFGLCLFFMISGFGGYGLYYSEAAAISIDINPSIELSINRWGRVVGQKAFGADGELVLQHLTLTHMGYEEAVNRLLSSDAVLPYLDEDSIVSVTLETDLRKEEQYLSQLKACVSQTLSQHHSSVTAEFGCASSQERKSAHHYGLSMGKYCAIQEVLKADPGASMEEFQNQSMEEIITHKSSCQHGFDNSTASESTDTPESLETSGDFDNSGGCGWNRDGNDNIENNNEETDSSGCKNRRHGHGSSH